MSKTCTCCNNDCHADALRLQATIDHYSSELAERHTTHIETLNSHLQDHLADSKKLDALRGAAKDLRLLEHTSHCNAGFRYRGGEYTCACGADEHNAAVEKLKKLLED